MFPLFRAIEKQRHVPRQLKKAARKTLKEFGIPAVSKGTLLALNNKTNDEMIR